MAVVTLHPGAVGRHYRLPTERDYQAVLKAQRRLTTILDEWEQNGKKDPCPVPNEPTPAGGGSGAGRAFSVQKYGMMEFRDLFMARQIVSSSFDRGTLLLNSSEREELSEKAQPFLRMYSSIRRP